MRMEDLFRTIKLLFSTLLPMKKFLRIPIAVILLLGVGFVYLVKNPELPLSQKVFNTLWIPTTTQPIEQTTTTGIDLTNCISYFDGCNNCTVENGKLSACTLMYCETPAEPKCNQYATGTEDPASVELANPASVNCENKWWKLEIVTSADGSQLGMCTLPDGTVCEERAYMRGECWTTNDWVSSPSNPGSEQPTACTMEYAPVCASVAIQCIKAPCNPIEQTFSNKCVMNQNKLATFLHNGECWSATR